MCAWLGQMSWEAILATFLDLSTGPSPFRISVFRLLVFAPHAATFLTLHLDLASRNWRDTFLNN